MLYATQTFSMLKHLLSLILTCFVIPAFATQADTSAYHLQRLKVNALLAERSSRFGQYDESLSKRTGIFGLQTKQDIKNSNDILRQIVLNDNNIFKELKILMDYKDQQYQQVQRTAADMNSRLENYRASIKKLQDENERLKQDTGGSDWRSIGLVAFFALIISWIVFFYKFNRKGRPVT